MAELLDPSTEFTAASVQRIDDLVRAMNGGDPVQREYAVRLLNQIRENGTLWVHADKMIDYSSSPDTKFFALSLLDGAISTCWNGVPQDQRSNIKNYIAKLVIENSSAGTSPHFLHKLNQVLVQIVKRDWTSSWKNFIPEICAASKSSQPLCENTMDILKMLSQEIFESSSNLRSSTRRALKDTMNSEFSTIHELCNWVLKTAALHPGAVQNSLVKACLSTLSALLDWIPAVHIFSGDLVSLISHYLDNPLFAPYALDCLSEVAKVKMELSPEDPSYLVYESAVVTMITEALAKLNSSTPVAGSLLQQAGLRQTFQQLALFLLSIAENHLRLIDEYSLKHTNSEGAQNLLLAMDSALKYICQLMELPEEEIFKICCDFWKCLAEYLYQGQAAGWGGSGLWFEVYRPYLTTARTHIIGKMAKPTEVTVNVDEQGNTVIEKLQDTEGIALYEVMRETLVYLTHLDPEDTQNTVMLKMAKQMDGSEWSWQRVSSLAYAIGSISGAMDEQTEKRFLIHTIKDLLALCEGKRGKENKAVVATNIMYVVMQYPRFLSKHWNFMKTVLKKLFEFMRERHPGIQDMSVDTFLRIAQSSSNDFLIIHEHTDQAEPFISEIERDLDSITRDLESHQKLVVYQALGWVLAGTSDETVLNYHVRACLALLAQEWDRALEYISSSNSPGELEVSRSLVYCLKAQDAFAGALGHSYFIALNVLYPQLIEVYRVYSSFTQAQLVASGDGVLGHSYILSARAVRRRVLTLFSTYFRATQDIQSSIGNYAQTLLEVVLSDFIAGPEKLRETEVISLVADMTNKAGTLMMPFMGVILGSFLDCLLPMLSKDFTTYPEHRSAFFELLKSVTTHCLEGLVQLPIDRFKLAVDTVLWACKHQTTALAEAGLSTLLAILLGLQHSAQVANYFYQHFYLYVLKEVFAIMTDSANLPNFKHHGDILVYLFYIIETGVVSVSLGEATDNKSFVTTQLTDVLFANFTNMKRTQIEAFVLGMFNRCSDSKEFKQTLRDFLVISKEIAADSEELYAEEREKELEEGKKRTQQQKMAVPGLWK